MRQSHPLHDVWASRRASVSGGGRSGLLIPGGSAGARGQRRGMGRLQAQDQFLPLLVSATLLTTLALVFIAYLTVRADVLASQQQQVSRDARIARALLAGPGGSFTLRGSQLVATSASGQIVLNTGGAQLVRVRELTGAFSALYAMQGTGLVAVAADGLGAVGQPPPAEAVGALIGDCGPLAPPSCHHQYVGGVHLHDGQNHDGDYTAAFLPLFDTSGVYVGAVGVAQPQSVVLAPAAQFTIVLLFVGLLVTLIVLAAGTWTYNALSGEAQGALRLRLSHLATVAAELEHAAHTQVVAARRQERIARQISDGARDIDTLVHSMKLGHLTMHESATGIWAEMSQPGVAPDPVTAMRFARQAVVMAARVGVATEDARTRCNAVVRLMNQVIAEGHALSGHGYETERRAAELRVVVEQIERISYGPPACRGVLRTPTTPGASSSPSRLVSLSDVPEFSPAPEPLGVRRTPLLARAVRMAHEYGAQIRRYLVERAAELAGQNLSPYPLPGAGRGTAAAESAEGAAMDAEDMMMDAEDPDADAPWPFSQSGGWGGAQRPDSYDAPDDAPAGPRPDNDTLPRR